MLAGVPRVVSSGCLLLFSFSSFGKRKILRALDPFVITGVGPAAVCAGTNEYRRGGESYNQLEPWPLKWLKGWNGSTWTWMVSRQAASFTYIRAGELDADGARQHRFSLQWLFVASSSIACWFLYVAYVYFVQTVTWALLQALGYIR